MLAHWHMLTKPTVLRRGNVIEQNRDANPVVERRGLQQVKMSSGAPLATGTGRPRRTILTAFALCALATLCFNTSGLGDRANAGTTGGTPTKTPKPSAANARSDFVRYRNARFGYELMHPRTFVAQDPPPNGAGQAWISADGMFELNTFASFNSDGATLQSLKQDLLTGDARFRNDPTAAVGGDVLWVFSESGPRAYGYAAIFSCNNQIVNGVEISFPARSPDRDLFHKLAEDIITGFKAGVGEDSPGDCEGAPQSGGSAETQATTAQSADHPFSDPSLKRLAVYGWSTAGQQNGLWSAGINGGNGTLLYVKCSTGRGDLRNGSIGLRGLRQLPNLAGGHQVNVEMGDYQHGGVFTFSPGSPGSNGILDIVEDAETAGVYLEFLRALASGGTLTIEVLESGYRETFNLFAADYALGPCLGKAIEQPWSNHGERDGVIGTSVRNKLGGAFYVRCDATAAARGGAVVAFAAPQQVPTPGVQPGQVKTIRAFVGTRSQNLQFMLTPEPNVMTGVVYHAAGAGNAPVMSKLLALISGGDETEEGDEDIADMLSLLGGGTELRLLSPDLGVDTSFNLYGARQSLAPCSKLY